MSEPVHIKEILPEVMRDILSRNERVKSDEILPKIIQDKTEANCKACGVTMKRSQIRYQLTRWLKVGCCERLAERIMPLCSHDINIAIKTLKRLEAKRARQGL